jgi:hypothetical protein
VLVAWSVLACSSVKTTPPITQAPSLHVDWAYEKDAIRLVFKGDRSLNFYKGVQHALSLCIYQLKDPNAFNQLAGDPNGISVLLGCETFDPAVTSFRRLAAGFYRMERERVARLMEIPVEIRTTGWVLRDKFAVAGPLNLEVTLGPEQIDKVEAFK